jgi:hypothetical protein
MNNYIFNLETTKIELHFEKSEYDALSDEQKKKLKGTFLWSNKGKCWVSRAKEPNLYRAKLLAKELGFTEEQREGERLSYAEQLEKQSERAEERADRYDGYADNAAKRGTQLQKELNSFRGDIAFFTQPNVNSSSGRAFTNYREKLYARHQKGFEEYRKSDYFRNRAETARETASDKKFKDPAYLDRRIKECRKEIRAREKNIIYYEETLTAIENGMEKKKFNGKLITIEEATGWVKNELELIEKAMDKQGYLENCLDDLGGIRFNQDNIKPGYIVRLDRRECVEIVGTGPVNVTYRILEGGAAGMTLLAAYAEISEIVKEVDKKREPQPFKVGEQFTTKKYVYEKDSFKRKTIEVIYEIIKASDTTIQLRPVGTDDKPITRKPRISHNNIWVFSVDNVYGNAFYKEGGEMVAE